MLTQLVWIGAGGAGVVGPAGVSLVGTSMVTGGVTVIGAGAAGVGEDGEPLHQADRIAAPRSRGKASVLSVGCHINAVL